MNPPTERLTLRQLRDLTGTPRTTLQYWVSKGWLRVLKEEHPTATHPYFTTTLLDFIAARAQAQAARHAPAPSRGRPKKVSSEPKILLDPSAETAENPDRTP